MKLNMTIMAVLMVFLLGGCGLIQEAKIQKQVLADQNLPSDIRQAIQDRQIKVGMTKEQIIAAWGNPCWYCYGTRESSWGDTWEYNPFGTGRYSVGAGTYLFFDAAGRLKGWSK